MAEAPRVPDLDAQRAALKRLEFLIGRWAGEARILRGPAGTVEMIQTEEAHYKLGGLLLMIEGIGRAKSDGKPLLQALAIISYDDETRAYRMRAFNDGRFLETEVKVLDTCDGIEWGFALGEVRTKSLMRINERGDWIEVTELTVGSRPSQRFMELTVSRQE